MNKAVFALVCIICTCHGFATSTKSRPEFDNIALEPGEVESKRSHPKESVALKTLAVLLLQLSRPTSAWLGMGNGHPTLRFHHSSTRVALRPTIVMRAHDEDQTLSKQPQWHQSRRSAIIAAMAAVFCNPTIGSAYRTDFIEGPDGKPMLPDKNFKPERRFLPNQADVPSTVVVPLAPVKLTSEQRSVMMSAQCVEATQVEIFPYGDTAAVNECLLLPQRAVSLPDSGRMLFLRQGDFFGLEGKSKPGYNGPDGTGTAVWGGGIALIRYMEKQGADYWKGKKIVELGCGTGLAAITAVKLGAASVVATDDDPKVLELSNVNAGENLNVKERERFATVRYRWGDSLPQEVLGADLVIASDVIYKNDVYPFLEKAIRSLGAKALIACSQRRVEDLDDAKRLLSESGFKYNIIDSPMKSGYAAQYVKMFEIEPPKA